MVRLGRLERPTSCFGGTRSIQLSYSRAHHLYHAFRVMRMVVLLFNSKNTAWRICSLNHNFERQFLSGFLCHLLPAGGSCFDEHRKKIAGKMPAPQFAGGTMTI